MLRITGLPTTASLAYFILRILSASEERSLPPSILPVPRRILTVLGEETDLDDVSDAMKALAPLWPGDPIGAACVFESPLSWPAALEKMRAGGRLILATPEALRLDFPGPDSYERERWTLEPGQAVGRQKLLDRLEAMGYSRAEFAEGPGEYAARGQVVDVFLPEPARAVRFLFSGDAVETARLFDPETQRTEKFLDTVTILPIRKSGVGGSDSLTPCVPGQRSPGADSLTPPPAGEVPAAPEGRLAAGGVTPRVPRPEGRGADGPRPSGGFRDWFSQGDLILSREGLEVPRWPGISHVEIFREAAEGGWDAGLRPHCRYQGSLELVVRDIRDWRSAGIRTLLYGLNRGEEERLRELLEPKLPEGAAEFLIGPLGAGFLDEGRRLSILTSGEIFERSYRVRALQPWQMPKPPGRFGWASLKKGDYVVHKRYGIARYLGLAPARETGDRLPEAEGHRARTSPGMAQDCLLMEFRGGDRLYVPLYDFQCVQKYIGAEGKRPRLSALDTATWESAQKRAQEGVAELAQEILKREAGRKVHGGHAFPPDSHIEIEFAEAFPFEETPGQKKAIEEVMRDMQEASPMNRLIVGDVGFGKTEVAMRAALKAVLDSKQVAILVPTTVLADQHARNFSRRFADYPVRLGVLSRFLSRADQKKVLSELAAGRLDVVIGTHRLIQKDVRFRDLGLIVIDEEHRFGVKDKERLKAFRMHVDVLSLSATPIPRTLYTALSGLRSISLIESPPQGRQPIQTSVAPFSLDLVVRAIHKELERGGQVFYVYNRVQGLPDRVRTLQEACPGVRFLMAHGQMPSGALEKAMWDFLHSRYEVLVASSIIESGLDIPTVNTLIVEEAQDFGLAQLYQLRGRVGREKTRACCHLLYPAAYEDYEHLSEDAKKRLSALREFSALGSGFRLALRDLEIRGAGDLLGAQQHGFLNSVGLEYYCSLLNREIDRLKGRPTQVEEPVTLDLRMPAGIPAEYLPSELDRIEFYKRLLGAGEAELEGIAAELEDLCGPPPPSVRTLLKLVRIKARARQAGIRSISEKEGGAIEVTFRPGKAMSGAQVETLVRDHPRRLRFLKSKEGDGFRLDLDGADLVGWAEAFLSAFVSK